MQYNTMYNMLHLNTENNGCDSADLHYSTVLLYHLSLAWNGSIIASFSGFHSFVLYPSKATYVDSEHLQVLVLPF